MLPVQKSPEQGPSNVIQSHIYVAPPLRNCVARLGAGSGGYPGSAIFSAQEAKQQYVIEITSQDKESCVMGNMWLIARWILQTVTVTKFKRRERSPPTIHPWVQTPHKVLLLIFFGPRSLAAWGLILTLVEWVIQTLWALVSATIGWR